MKAVIPFAGFYESCHSRELDHAADSIVQDDNGDPGPCADRFAREFHYTSDMLNAYARLYVKRWSELTGIRCTFAKVDSPREYNFETDRIFVDIDVTHAAQLLAQTDDHVMSRIARERHTSRSGFISFYDADWRTWGPVAEWDPEPMRTLILAFIESQAIEMPAEYEIVDDCNGDVSNLVWDHMPDKAKRIARIADYLRIRKERARGR
jgi:hypothetical protein